jgi:ketosteroid isomerase-like protein
MRKVLVGIVVLLAIGVIYFGTPSPTLPPEMTEAEIAHSESEAKQAIEGRWDEYIDAVIRADIEELMSFWTQDMRILGPGLDLDWTGYETHLDEIHGAGVQYLTYVVKPFDIFVHGDVAYWIGQMDQSFQPPGGSPQEVHGYLSVRWERPPGGEWIIDRVVWGPRDAPPEG